MKCWLELWQRTRKGLFVSTSSRRRHQRPAENIHLLFSTMLLPSRVVRITVRSTLLSSNFVASQVSRSSLSSQLLMISRWDATHKVPRRDLLSDGRVNAELFFDISCLSIPSLFILRCRSSYTHLSTSIRDLRRGLQSPHQSFPIPLTFA